MSQSNNTPDALLDVRNLGRRIPGGDGWLLRNITMQIRPGDRIGLVGPTGSGKTLLLRSLALLDPIDSGDILWNGQTINDVPAYRQRAIYLHQQPALLEGDVEMNLRLPIDFGVNRGRQFDRERILALLALLGLDASFLQKSHAALSGGEGQITALLRAVQFGPQLLLLDEPTAALDPQAAQSVEQLVQKWWNEDPNRAYIWVSHQREQISRVSSCLLKLTGGRVADEVD